MLLISDCISKTFEVDSNLDLFFVICFCHHYIWLQDKDLKLCMKGQGHCWRSFTFHKTISMWTQELYNLEVFSSLCVIFCFVFWEQIFVPFCFNFKISSFSPLESSSSLWSPLLPHFQCVQSIQIQRSWMLYTLIARLLFTPCSLVLAKTP